MPCTEGITEYIQLRFRTCFSRLRMLQDDGIAVRGLPRCVFAYSGEVVKRPLYTQQGIHHFELFGRIEMSYDSIQDILNLSYYGNYYRKED